MIMIARSVLLATLLLNVAAHATEPEFPLKAKRNLVLGDSNTYAGHYLTLLEAQLRLSGYRPELLNLGLPSETCSGLSEPEHPFPRPSVHERMDRALAKLQPDVVVACYGMNDAIYYPFADDRFSAYTSGIDALIQKVHASGARLVLMSPPAFDPLPLKRKGRLQPLGADQYSWKSIYEDYDDVMRAYATWVSDQATRVEMVVDLHTPIRRYLAEKRESDPEFTMSPDGVHLDLEGHEVLARAILKAWGVDEWHKADTGLLTLVDHRQKLLRDAWLGDVGHLRPDVKPGLSVAEATAEAAEIEKQIRARVLRHHDARGGFHKDVHHVHFPASTKRGELSIFADYFLWIPENASRIRGLIVHQHGCGAGASSAGLTAAADLHWRALAEKWDCALLGSSYEGKSGQGCRLWCEPRNGSAQRFLQAIEHFAAATDHPELSSVPWCLWGHSGGGFWASIMQTLYPDRIVAIWLQSGTAFGRWERGEIDAVQLSEAVFQVPVMACPGVKEREHERFHTAWDGSMAMFRAYRQRDAPFGFAPDPRSGHECADSRYLAIPFFDQCLAARLPNDDSDSPALRPIDMSRAYLGSWESATAVKADGYEGSPRQMSWLPSQSFADQWIEFVKTGAVSDDTPPPPPKKVTVSVEQERVVIGWTAAADFESGLRGFRVLREGAIVGEVPADPKGRFGRPLFQSMSYSDTPDQPLARMRLVVPSAVDGRYQVISVNSVGLESSPVEVTVP